MSKKEIYILSTPLETEAFAEKFAKTLHPNSILLLIGDLGTGKTTFVKGLSKGLGVSQEVMVHSPTFTLINEYPGKVPLFHVDLYRLNHLREIEELDLESYFQREGVVAIEWAERAMALWPKNAVCVRFALGPKGGRKIEICPSCQLY